MSAPRPGLRAGDQERHDAVQVLAAHHAAGRLDLTEFTERMERAEEAVYLADLDPLFADLPPRLPPEVVAGSLRRRHPRPPVLFAVAAVAVVLVVATTAGAHPPWFLLVVAGWFVLGPRARWRHRRHLPGAGQTTPYNRSPASPSPGTM